MTTAAATAAADDTLLAACRQIEAGGMGSVPVIDAAGVCVGVLSGWDVVRAIGMGADLDSTTAAEVVGGDGAVHPDDDFAALSSSQAGIVVPVVEQNGSYLGAVGPADVLAAKALGMVLYPTDMPDSGLTVRDMMSTEAPTAAAGDTLLAACRQMHVGGMGSVPVIDAAGGCVGVLAVWDVVRAIAAGAGIDDTTAAEFAAADAVLHPDDGFDQAVSINHAAIVTPVVEDGSYLGAIGPGDIDAAREVITVLGPEAGRLDTTISPRETMYGGLRGPYLLAGTSALALVRMAMARAGMAEPEAILDFPCGHGRVMRFLHAAFPESTLIACDIDREGVDFCAQTFGALPVYSDADPEVVQIGEQVDLIWVGSLFTHIHPARWNDFLALFARALRPGGVLVLSTFDRPRLPVLNAMNLADARQLLRERDERGVAFQSYVHEQDYGIALAGADHVREALAFGGAFEFLGHEPLCLFQPVPTQDAWMYRRADSP
jgi:CBS domain-containing protein/SAM-dependent methyltransferase